MKKSYRYRIFPTKKQEHILNEQLSLLAELYNAALQERKDAYRMCGIHITYDMQAAQLPEIKAIRPEYRTIHSQVLQDVLRRVDKAFKDFFRRVKTGQAPGYPRYRSRYRYHSLTYPQSGFGVEAKGPAPGGKNRQAKQRVQLVLSKIGPIKLKKHRPTAGAVKTCTITRSATGKWYCCFSCDEVERDVLPPTHTSVGIDVGLATFAYLSDGSTIENPRFFREDEPILARAQRKLSRAPKGSKEREKRRKVAARIHERIGNRRHNFIHQQTRRLVNIYDLLALEDLAIRNLIKNSHLAKSIADAAWSAFVRVLLDKAAEADRAVMRVAAAYTTQTCSACGHRQKLPLSVRVYECDACSLILHRDHNASINILNDALRELQAIGRYSGNVPEASRLER